MSIPSTSSETSPSPQPDQAHSHLASQVQQTVAAATSAPVQAPKRSSRRANTAERRATHNAVERARRETLNGRFLDLAAMLPNLAAVRRPSKSAIVNSSIALIHNQSRARIIAAREIRLLNAEANALRQELNEWRARNALPRVEEPIRSADFSTLMAVEDVEMGEEMVLSGRRSFDDGTGLGDDDDYGDDGEDGAELISPETAHHPSFVGLRPPMQYQQQQQQQQQAQAQQAQLAAQQQQQQQQQQLFEQQKAAMARAQQAQFAQAQAQAQAQQARYAPAVHHQHSQSQPVNLFTDNMFPTDLYPGGNAPTWSQKAIAANSSLATPPGSAHGHKQASYAATANSAFLAGHNNMGGMFKPAYSASEDDQSDGSSHYSGVEHNGAAIDQTFSFGLSSNYGMNLGMQVPSVNMNLYPGMQMPPSPPHTGSPTGSNPQSRRPSVNIPAQHGLGLVGHGGSNKSSPSPVPMSAQQQYGMGLMI